MKYLLTFWLVSLFICSVQAQVKSTTQRYKQLQRNPAYQGMSLIEIAAETDDFPAITSFMNKASLNDLLNAHVTLEAKRDQLEVNLKEKPPRDIIGVARVAEDKSKIQQKIDQLENMMNLLNVGIKRMRPQSKGS